MKEDYVTYKQAVKLRELGFSEETTGKYFDCPEDPTLCYGALYQPWNLERDETIAPTLSMAQKWLREELQIDVLVFNCACGYGWEVSQAGRSNRGTTLELYDDKGDDKDSGMWTTYELALSAGINAALDILISSDQ